MQKQNLKYRFLSGSSFAGDGLLFWFVYPVFALGVVHIGNDNSLAHLLSLPSYYTDLLLAFASTYAAGLYFRMYYKTWQKKFASDAGSRRRFIHVLNYGLASPFILLLAIEAVYLVLFLHIPLSQSSIFYLEAPLILLFLLLINFFYLLQMFRRNLQNTSHPSNGQPAAKSNFPVYQGHRLLNLTDREVAYFIRLQQSTFLVTTDNRQYIYNHSLEKTISEVDPLLFYQLNRQVIAHRQSILACHATETRKLQVELNPPPTDPVYVSKEKATSFRNWLSASEKLSV